MSAFVEQDGFYAGKVEIVLRMNRMEKIWAEKADYLSADDDNDGALLYRATSP